MITQTSHIDTSSSPSPAEFQLTGRDFLASNKQALLCDEMRLGKSMQGVLGVDKLGAERILITCPASVKYNWAKEFNKWSDRERTCQIVTGRRAKINPKANITIINYDLLPYVDVYRQMVSNTWDVAITDEFHYLKGMDSARTEAMLLEGGILYQCEYNWAFSGTPILNRPVELFPILQGFAPQNIAPYNTFASYTKHFCGGYWNGREWFDKGATNTDELNRRLHSGLMLRRLRKDVLKELPKEHQILYVPLESSHVKDLVAKEFNFHTSEASKLAGGFGDDPVATVRRELGEAMVPYALRHIQYLLTCEAKIVVFAWHKSVIAKMYEMLQAYSPAVIGGRMSAAQKKVSEDRFREDPSCRLMIGQHISAGQGLDFCASRFILNVELDWTPGVMDQSGDRCSGWNQEYAVMCQYMAFADSLQEHQLRTVIDKMNVIDKTIEDKHQLTNLYL